MCNVLNYIWRKKKNSNPKQSKKERERETDGHNIKTVTKSERKKVPLNEQKAINIDDAIEKSVWHLSVPVFHHSPNKCEMRMLFTTTAESVLFLWRLNKCVNFEQYKY